jgi:hypothetical protein
MKIRSEVNTPPGGKGNVFLLEWKTHVD